MQGNGNGGKTDHDGSNLTVDWYLSVTLIRFSYQRRSCNEIRVAPCGKLVLLKRP